MPKGSKTCPNCGATCGPRTYVCASCQHVFIVKQKPNQPTDSTESEKSPEEGVAVLTV